MKIERKTITTDNYFVKLEADDWLGLDLGNGRMFGVKVSLVRRSLDLYALQEGGLVGDPVFSITYNQLEDLKEAYPEYVEYVNITFPAKYSGEVRKRLKGLPIVMPILKEKEEGR